MRRTVLLLVSIALALLLACGVALTGMQQQARAATTTFSNTTMIDFPACRTPTPRPSKIAISGIKETVISDVDLTLKGLSHTYVVDMDARVVGPTGEQAAVMSDVGGGSSVRLIDLVLDDEAGSPLPFDAPLTGGTFRPANYEGFSDGYEDLGSALSVFDGTDPNGTWKLYISDYDEACEDGGSISGGWGLRITSDVRPFTNIDSGPASTVPTDQASFSFSSSEAGSTFKCALDGYYEEPCTSPKRYTGLADGTHTFEVRAIDGAGNADTSPARRTWTVDTDPPETTIPHGPDEYDNGYASFLLDSSEPEEATYKCRLDGAPFESCGDGKGYSDLAEGPHVFEAKAIDAVGNVDATPARHEWIVDKTAPIVKAPTRNLVVGSLIGSSTVPVNLTWSATDPAGVAGYQLHQSINGGAFSYVYLPTRTTTSITPSLEAGKTYRYQVYAWDTLSNNSAWKLGPSFAVDLRQETHQAITYSGTWALQSSPTASGGYVKHASASGTRAKFSFTGKHVAWVASTGSNRGKAEVWVDGVKVQTVDLYAPTAEPRKMVFTKAWTTSANHTVEVRALGTKNAASTGTRVDVDAFVALR